MKNLKKYFSKKIKSDLTRPDHLSGLNTIMAALYSKKREISELMINSKMESNNKKV